MNTTAAAFGTICTIPYIVLAWVNHVNPAHAVGLALWIMYFYWNWEAGRDDTRKEAAYGDHCNDPTNPLHLARFGVFAGMAARSRAIAGVCASAWVALLVYQWAA